MDDTAILATSREKLQQKYETLLDFCREFGMEINEGKSNLMVINGSEQDRMPLLGGERPINHSERYTYLGIPFSSDGKMSTALKAHSGNSQKHLLKLSRFVSQNPDFPYIVKKKV